MGVTKREFKYGCLAAAGAVVVVALVVVWFVVHQFIVTTTGVTHRVFDPDHVLSAYSQFHDDCHKVLAFNEQIKTQEGTLNADLADTSPDPLGQRAGIISRDRTAVEALKNQRESVAQDYNSNSNKYSESAFKESNLPASIDPPDYTTSCEYKPRGTG